MTAVEAYIAHNVGENGMSEGVDGAVEAVEGGEGVDTAALQFGRLMDRMAEKDGGHERVMIG